MNNEEILKALDLIKCDGDCKHCADLGDNGGVGPYYKDVCNNFNWNLYRELKKLLKE